MESATAIVLGVVQHPSKYDGELLKVHLEQASGALPGPDSRQHYRTARAALEDAPWCMRHPGLPWL